MITALSYARGCCKKKGIDAHTDSQIHRSEHTDAGSRGDAESQGREIWECHLYRRVRKSQI